MVMKAGRMQTSDVGMLRRIFGRYCISSVPAIIRQGLLCPCHKAS